MKLPDLVLLTMSTDLSKVLDFVLIFPYKCTLK